jgi:hypothetical protein
MTPGKLEEIAVYMLDLVGRGNCIICVANVVHDEYPWIQPEDILALCEYAKAIGTRRILHGGR